MQYNIIRYIWLLTLVLFTKANGQSYYNAYLELIKNNSPNQITKSVDSLIRLTEGEKDYHQKIQIAHAYSLALNNDYAHDLAIKYGLIDVSGYENNLKLSNTKYSNALFNLGLFYMKKGDIPLAIFNFKKVIVENNYPKKIGQAFCQMGNSFYIVGDVYKAVDFYKKGLNILEKENINLYTYNAFDLSWIYEQINTPKSLNSKINLLKHLEQISVNTSLSFTQLINLNNDIASYYDNDNFFDFEKSKSYYQKNIDLSVQTNNQRHLGTIYTSLGGLYTYTSIDSSLYYFKKGLELAKTKITVARNHNLTAKYYLINKDSKKALEASNKSLKASLNVTQLNLESINLLKQSFDKDVTIWALIHKSEALIQHYYNSDSSIDLIKEALYNLSKADELITEINKNDFEEASQLHWQEEAVKIYANAVICSHLLNNPELAFSYIEKSKTLLLNQAISRNISKYQLPEALNLKRFTFKKHILDLKHKLDTTENKTVKKILQDSLFITKYGYDLFTDSLKKTYPLYKTNESKTSTVNISKIQNELDTNSIVLSYSWPNDITSNKIGLVAISKKRAVSFLITNTKEFENLIYQFKASIAQPLNTEQELKAYKNVAYKLFKLLIPDSLLSIIYGKNIIIIPDGHIQHLPFEALISKENSSDFLIKSSMISYAYSMTSLLNNNTIKRSPSKNLIAFSPVSFKNKTLTPLEYTKTEIKDIVAITSGDSFNNKNASKTNFLKNTSDSKIIHLATHASANKNPWVAFYDSKLFLHELYTYKNQANLVVLSACNTSTGEIAKGEGVLSLARGFFYSGAKSVISTLWNVNDKSSSILMTNFYKNLKKGETKVTALHNAKLDYINSHSLSESSPYYWASFVLIGDTNAIVFSSNYGVFFFIACSFGLLFFINFLYKNKK